MPQLLSTSRRQFVGVSLASLAVTTLTPSALRSAAGPARASLLPAAKPALPTPAVGADTAIVAAARTALERTGALIAHHDVVGVADFRHPSRAPRLHLVDLAGGKVDSLLVAHGRGSDPNHTGWLSSFSNAPNSQATSAGAYATGDYYIGEHGRSMRLKGLDPSNSNAETRGIVVHDAWYVGPNIVRGTGKVGCSEGCFAVSQADLPKVLARLGPGRLLVATRL